MTKDVLVSISGLQFEIEQDDAIEVITTGEYYYRNGKHYVLYEELFEDYGVTKNTIKISDKKVNIMKQGSTAVNMVFEENKQNLTYYNTPFGELLIGINTLKVEVTEQEEEIHISIRYLLDINYAHIAECIITIKITSKKELLH